MKKNKNLRAWYDYYYALKKTFRIMRIAILFLLIGILQSYANNVYSQKTKLSLNYENTRLVDVLNDIEDNSEFFFLYNEKLVDPERKVSISVKDKKIDEILNVLFFNTDVKYSIVDRKIVLAPEFLDSEQGKITVSGKVTDTGGQPLPGVSVVVKGTTQGTVTNADGEYSLSNIPAETILQFSFVGMKMQEIVVNDKTNINITMVEEAIGIGEVVAVGYGTMKKNDLTGAISQVKGETLKNLPVRSVADALQGKTAGVMITSTSGSPGSAPAVRIRGVGTINDNDPLYVVDGLPQSSIGWLNTNEIESIDILKDASATAIYGARAANGVILITTSTGKKGEKLQSSIDFDAYFGMQNPIKVYDMMNASEFMEYKNLAYTNGGYDAYFTSEEEEEILKFIKSNTGSEEGTNWWKEINNKNAPVQSYNISFSGGMKDFSYRSSVGYMNQDGIINGSDYERISWRTNFDHNIKSWLKVTGNIGLIHETKGNVLENSPGFNTAFIAFVCDPISPVYRTNLKDIPSFLESSFFFG